MMIRSRKLLNAAKGEPCICCSVRDDTVVAAHYQGLRSHLLGKGTGMKPHDICVAHLCARCHILFDSTRAGGADQHVDPYIRKIVSSEEFLTDIVLTIIKLIQQGKLVIHG